MNIDRTMTDHTYGFLCVSYKGAGKKSEKRRNIYRILPTSFRCYDWYILSRVRLQRISLVAFMVRQTLMFNCINKELISILSRYDSKNLSIASTQWFQSHGRTKLDSILREKERTNNLPIPKWRVKRNESQMNMRDGFERYTGMRWSTV